MISAGYVIGDEMKIATGPDQWHVPFVPSLAEVGDAITIWENDVPRVIVGIIPMWDGVAEGWSVIDVEDRVPVREMIRMVTWWMDTFCKGTGVRRLESSAGSEAQYKWMRFLGFMPEYVKVEVAPDGSNMIGMVKWFRRLH